jgi:hypothetical protein
MMPLGRDIRMMYFIIPVASEVLTIFSDATEHSINSKNIFHQSHLLLVVRKLTLPAPGIATLLEYHTTTW